jgi:N-methylhydantoinase B
MNCPLASTISACRLVLKMIVAPKYDANEGFFRPLKVVAEEGSVLNPKAPAPVLLYGWATMAIGEALFAAFAQAVPDRAVARSAGDIGALLFSGRTPDGTFFAGGCDECCGQGASIDADGESALIDMMLGECRNIPVEILEERFPFLTESYSLWQDSGGPGRNRGGLGVRRRVKVLSEISLISVFDQTKAAGEGVDGGRPGKTNILKISPETSNERRIGKVTGYKVRKGEVMEIEMGGGAGWGDPLERDPRSVLTDVAEGYVSIDSAARDYGVAVTLNGQRQYQIDEVATREMRSGRPDTRTANTVPAGKRTHTRSQERVTS